MKKKLGVIITLLTLCICLMTPQMHAKAASGKTTIAVSAGSLNIGQTVTVTAKALSASGDSAYANMVLTYDAGILEFVSCNATYGGGGGSISVASDSFSVTLKAISAGKAAVFVLLPVLLLFPVLLPAASFLTVTEVLLPAMESNSSSVP